MVTVTDNRFGKQIHLETQVDQYKDGSVRLDLIEDGMPYATATVCLSLPPPEDCIWVKSWSENVGMDHVLFKSGLINPEPIATMQVGFVNAYAYRMTEKLLNEIKNV